MTSPSDPHPPARQLRVVSLLDPSGLIDRLRARPEDIRPGFHTIADLQKADVAGYEVVLGLEGAEPRTPRAWAQGVHVQETGSVEGPLVAAALAARQSLSHGRFLAVSVSTHGLVSPEVSQALTAAGRLDDVVIIVTDDNQGADQLAVTRALDAVRDAGGAFAIDETGSGYASLTQVLRLRPDYVRIGADFVVEIDRDHAKAAVVESLASLASRIDATVIAGGIPSRHELDALRRLGISLGQGPLLGENSNAIAPLSTAMTKAIREATPAPAPERTVASLVEARPPVGWGAPIEDLADAFLEDPRHDTLVLVDARSRPLALAERAALLRGEAYERPVMRITPSSPLKAVARRAAARPAMERYHPLVVCDRRGVYLGIVRVEQILDALAQ